MMSLVVLRRIDFWFLVFSWLIVGTALAQQGEETRCPPVDVSLALGPWIQYDPSVERSKEMGPYGPSPTELQISIENRSAHEISLPKNYDARWITIWAITTETGHPLVLIPARQPKEESQRLMAGESRVCFTLRIKDILHLGDSKEATVSRSQWGWSWGARLRPPISPVRQVENKWQPPTIVLWAEVRMGNQMVRSEPRILTLKSQ